MMARRIGAIALLLMPVAIAAGDYFRITSEDPDHRGAGVGDVTHQLAYIDAHRSGFETAGWMFTIAAVLTLPLVLLVWRLTVDRAPKAAWVAGVLGSCFAVGQFVHLYGYFGAQQVASAADDRHAAAQLLVDWNSNALSNLVFMPFLIGFFLSPLAMTIALQRAGVVKWPAIAVIVVATVVSVALSTVSWGSVLWAVLFLAAVGPAARAVLAPGAAMPEREPVTV